MTEPLRLELPPPHRPRRSHAERTAETRARVIEATVDVIAEAGFARATAQAIAARAGVTWGAVQHHFGGKDGLLLAVVEDSFARFAEPLADLPLAGAPLPERVARFVDRAWEHFSGRYFRSTFEILLEYLGRGAHREAGDWRQRMAQAWDRVWASIFADANLPRHRSLALQHYALATLTGLAATRILAGGHTPRPRAELELLKDTLARALSPP